jgi:hypothetical protein
MNNGVETLGALMLVHQRVDRQVIAVMFRALMVNAPPEQEQTIRAFLDILRNQYETLVHSTSQTSDEGYERSALRHFEEWALEIDHMLDERARLRTQIDGGTFGLSGSASEGNRMKR